MSVGGWAGWLEIVNLGAEYGDEDVLHILGVGGNGHDNEGLLWRETGCVSCRAMIGVVAHRLEDGRGMVERVLQTLFCVMTTTMVDG
jgi:hypothetical protein